MTPPTDRVTILIVNDQPNDLSVGCDLLEEQGYRLVFARDGEACLQQARQVPPDLILLDAMLPDRDSIEICRCLKTDETTRDIPVLFIAAQGDAEHRTKGFAAGGADYLSKPLQANEVLARVSTQIKLQAAQRRVAALSAQLEQQEAATKLPPPETDALAMGRGLAERRNVQRRLEIHDLALNTSNDAVFLIDDTLRFVFVNNTACRSLGYSREELLTMGPPDIDPDVTPEVARAMVNTMAGCSGLPKFETRHRTKDGRIYPVEIGGAVFKYEGRTFGLSVVRDVTERKRMDDVLRFVAQRGWQAGGKNFFEALVGYLGQTLGVDYAMVAKLGEAQGSAETVALYARGAVVPNIRYDLASTPCEHVMGQNYCCYPSCVQQLFPEDSLLVNMDAESYAGIPLWDSCGQPLGLIAVLDGKPLQNEVWVAQLLQVVAPRAAAELERAGSDAQLRAREREFRSLAESSPDCIIRYDRAGRILYLNSQMVRELGIATSTDVIGRLPCSIWSDGRFAEIERAVAQAMETATDVTMETTVPRPSGSRVSPRFASFLNGMIPEK